MTGFINKLQGYLSHYTNRETVDLEYKKLLLPEQFSKFVQQEDFIKYSILSIFDDKKKIPQSGLGKSYDGIIDADEFASIGKKEYEQLVEEMKKSYKSSFGQEIKYHIPSYKELENMLKNDSPYEKEKKALESAMKDKYPQIVRAMSLAYEYYYGEVIP